MCKQCGHYFGSIKSNQQHSVVCRMKSPTVGKILEKKGNTTKSRCPSSTRATLCHGFPRAEIPLIMCNLRVMLDDLAVKSGTPILTNTDPKLEY